MKKLISTVFIFCLFFQIVLAQNTDFRNQMNTIFGNVDLSQVPSGILFDYGLNLVDDSLYNGTLTEDNILSPQMWKSLYADLWSSQVTTANLLPDIEDINVAIDSYAANEATLIPVLFYKYHRISPDALSTNLMYVSNDKLYDTPGRTQSPYLNQIAFAASTVQPRFETTDGVVKFVFEQDCYFSNSGLGVSTIAVDGNDGQGYRQVHWGTPFTCGYSEGGDKDVKVKFTFSDNSTLYSHFTITVDVNIPLKSARYYNTETLTINPADVRAYNGQKASGEVTIIYNGSTTTLDKPLIVFEGYDTWKILTPDNPERNISWTDLLDEQYEMGYFIPSFQSSIASRGYDIVFVDFDNGTDYIQRNAYFAEAVIKAVNQRKSGNEPNVVMGISMGGLVARYALADMEARAVNHDARLFISMDSPHQGANVPLGLQAMIRHLTDIKVEVGIPVLGLTGKIWDIGATYPEYSALINLLQQPATRQMLIQQLSGFGEGMYIDNSLHTAFMQEYEQLGYPSQCRNIAVSNGSGATSTSWQYTPGTNIFDLDADCTASWWSGFLGPFVIAASPFVKQLWEMPVITLASILPGSYGVKAGFNVKALPNTGTTKVFDGKIKIVKKILWLIPVSSTLTSKSINYTGNGMPWDSGQGGYMPFSSYTGSLPSNLPSCVDITFPIGNFCFVPTISSLDIKGTQSLLKGYRAANDLQNSMFDNIYTEPSYNMIHTNFNPGNTNWIVLELDENAALLQQSNLYKFNGCAVNGPGVICSNGSTFTISNLPSGVSLSWETSDNIIISTSGTDYAILKATTPGMGWIKAKLSGGGVNAFSETKTVGVGEPIKDDFHFVMLNLSTGEYVSNFTNGNGNPAELCPNTVYQFWTDYRGPFTVQGLSWDLPSGWEIQAQYGSDNSFTTYFDVDDNVHTGLHLTVQTEECGWGNMLPGFYFLEDYSCGSYYLLISPNPSTGEATLSIESTSDEKAIDGDMEWELEIYGTNQMRKTKKTGLHGKSTKVNTSGWQEGVYPVRVIYRPAGKQEITLTGKLVVKS